MLVQIAHLYALMCLGLIMFQIALIAGLPWGPYTQGGQHAGALPLPWRVMAAVSILLLVAMGLAIVSAAGFGRPADLPQAAPFWPRWTGWAATAVSALSCLANWITPSAKERAIWAPITSVMLAMALYVMVISGAQAG